MPADGPGRMRFKLFEENDRYLYMRDIDSHMQIFFLHRILQNFTLH